MRFAVCCLGARRRRVVGRAFLPSTRGFPHLHFSSTTYVRSPIVQYSISKLSLVTMGKQRPCERRKVKREAKDPHSEYTEFKEAKRIATEEAAANRPAKKRRERVKKRRIETDEERQMRLADWDAEVEQEHQQFLTIAAWDEQRLAVEAEERRRLADEEARLYLDVDAINDQILEVKNREPILPHHEWPFDVIATIARNSSNWSPPEQTEQLNRSIKMYKRYQTVFHRTAQPVDVGASHILMHSTTNDGNGGQKGFKPLLKPTLCPPFKRWLNLQWQKTVLLIVRGIDGFCTSLPELRSFQQELWSEQRSRVMICFYFDSLAIFTRIHSLEEILDETGHQPADITYIQKRLRSLCRVRQITDDRTNGWAPEEQREWFTKYSMHGTYNRNNMSNIDEAT